MAQRIPQTCLRNSYEVAAIGRDAGERPGRAGRPAGRVLRQDVGLGQAGAVPAVEVEDRGVRLADEDAKEPGTASGRRIARDLRTDRVEVARLHADRVER